MKNLNNFTKAELISKFKRLESKNSNQTNNTPNQSLFNRLVEFVLWFKGLIFKIALISILIKTFKKYSFFSRLLRFTNWVILSIFGISVIDNFGLDFIKNFFLEFRTVLAGIILYFSNTTFYSFIASLFKSKEEITTKKISIREEPMSWESSRNESQIRESKRNSKISEWLKPEPEPIKEESNNTKYLIIAGIIIGCLAAYYWGDITPIIKNLYDRIKPKADGDGTNNNGVNRNIQSTLDDVKQKVKNLFYKNDGNNPGQPSLDNTKPSVEQRLKDIFDKNSDVTQIDLVDNTQNIASSSNVKLNSSHQLNNSMDQYFSDPIKEQLTGLREITGNHFTSESASVINEIDTFTSYHENASFPKAVVGTAFYNLIRERLHRLSEVSESRYSQLIENDEINNKIEKFIELEKEVYGNEVNSPINDQNNLDTQSNTYDEVALANLEAENTWSDKATPSQVLSPASSHANLDNSKLENLINEAEDLNDNDLMNKVKEVYAEEVKTNVDIVNTNQQVSSQDLPNIGINSASSSEKSIDQYFTKPDIEPVETKPKYKFSDMLDSIRSRRDDSNVVASPQISQLGLSPKLSPLNTKPSISNLLDDTTALFDDDDDITAPISNIDKGKEVDQNLLSTVSNPWDNVQTIINYGDSPNNIIVELEYGELWARINQYKFILTNGQEIVYDYSSFGNVTDKSRAFDLTKEIVNNTSEPVDIKKIILTDLDHRSNTVWTNSKFFN